MSNKVERGPYNANGAPPKYINDFSKALAGEVRILLDEVGKLRDERRTLQFEIAELMAVKSKHGAGGEYSENWQPKQEMAPAPPPLPIPEEEPHPQARPAWRTVHKRPERRDKRKEFGATPGPAGHAALPIASPAPRQAVPSWAQWRPDPLITPVAAHQPTPLPIRQPSPPRMGLFGPPSPPLK